MGTGKIAVMIDDVPALETTRARIIRAADQRFYEQGFAATSFADIAQQVGLSRGNFYHHFKTKDEILDAVIAHRLATTASMLDAWECEGESPAERLMLFARILVRNRQRIMAHGCPVGTLCNELAKLDHGALPDAAALFALFREWLARQFAALGHPADADALAHHLLVRSQGVATLATAFGDDAFVEREVDCIERWIAGLASQPAEREP